MARVGGGPHLRGVVGDDADDVTEVHGVAALPATSLSPASRSCPTQYQCLDILIHKLFDIGYTVRAIVSDCGGGNVGVWKEYSVNHNKSWFLSDITNKNIYFYADVPHLLKLIRNWFIDDGFYLQDGTLVSPEPVKSLIRQTQTTEISSCHRLTTKHVNCEKFERQNVSLVSQLMSNTTACAVRRYDVGDKRTRHILADFIQITNDWFDVLNSRVPISSIDFTHSSV